MVQMRTFKLKTIPAPWMGKDATKQVVDLEDALCSFPRPHETEGFVDSQGVFIGAKCHNMPTYVLVAPEAHSPSDPFDRSWLHGDQLVKLWSVNGGGECRWPVYPGGCHGKPDRQAIEGFGLEDSA
jgi:hypothetical protein